MPKAIERCSPKFRKLNGIIKFQESIDVSPPKDMTPEGKATIFENPTGEDFFNLYSSISSRFKNGYSSFPYVPLSHQVLDICLHEIFGGNYTIEKGTKPFNPKDPQYKNSEQEKTANKMALATLNETLETNYILLGGDKSFLELSEEEKREFFHSVLF